MSFIYLFREMWINAENNKILIVIYYLLHILSLLGLLGQPYVFGQIFNVLQENNQNTLSEVTFWVYIYIALFFIFNIFHRLGRHIEQRVAFRNRQYFINKLYYKLTKLPLKWHADNHSGSIINKIKISSDALHDFSELQFKYIEHFMMFWGPLLILAILSYKVAFAALFLGLFTVIIISKFDKVIVPLFAAENDVNHKFYSVIFDYISNIRTLLILRLDQQTKKEINNKIDLAYPVLTESIKINQYKWACVSFCILILEVGIIFYYINIEYYGNNSIMLGSIAAIFQYLQQLGKMFFNVTNDYQEIIRMKTDYLTSKDILAIDDFISGDLIQDNNWQKIDIKNLYFSYNNKKECLIDLNFSIQKGKKIALIGPSGGGKSSLLLLLRGLYHPDNCQIQVDERLFYSNLSSLSSITTLVPQDPEIFENTIKYNISFGVKYPEKEISNSIELASLEKLIKNLPNGLDTDIREKGVNLSGGEKQRLALARGILAAQNSSILLLDEPTSNIDSHNEELIYKKLFRKYKDKCIISSLHRLHLLELFDYIYVIAEGKIIQQGTLSNLLKSNKNSTFWNLWKKYMKNTDRS
jgi:ATP-binding cassette, subfamily B, bacterial